MNLASITPLILTFNEEANLERTLHQLQWAERIVLIDSGSSDLTLSIASRFPQVEVVARPFDSFHSQRNFGLGLVGSEWVLSLDADYGVTRELVQEIGMLPENPAVNGYFIAFRYCIEGAPLSATLLPPRPALFRRSHAHYVQDGHAELLVLEGASGRLSNVILHDDRKPLTRWLSSQDRYAQQESEKLQSSDWRELNLQDRARKTAVLAPLMVFFYALFVKGLIKDGWRGWFYVLQRVLAEVVLSLHLIERRLKAAGVTGGRRETT